MEQHLTRVWTCRSCGDRYVGLPHEDLGTVIAWHQRIGHHGQPIEGTWDAWWVIRNWLTPVERQGRHARPSYLRLVQG